MPKTTEAKTENSTAAVKWESSRVIRFFRSRLLPDGDVVGVGGADEIQQSGDNQKLGAVVGSGVGNCAMSPALHPGHDVEAACTHVAHESENVQDIAAVGLVDTALHEQAKDEHDGDRGHDQQTTNPALLDEMPRARDEPRDSRRNDRHAGGRRHGCILRFYGSALGRICHSDYYEFTLNSTCYLRCIGPDQHVYFAPHPEFRQIDARLDRKA